jgi:hypothetical protein
LTGRRRGITLGIITTDPGGGGMSDWADVLGSTIGGGVLSMLVWLGMKEPCPLGTSGLSLDCVRFGGGEYSLGEVAFFVPLIATAIGFAIHFARGSN